MELGVTMAFSQHTPLDYIIGAAQRIEAAGIASLWVPEHVLFFADYESSYPYSEDGRIPGEPEGILDPFSALTFVAAHTSSLRLSTGVCLVPQRQPVYTAKMVADLDYLSGGRVEFGIGVGWLKEEFDALGMDFSRRGDRTDEYLDVMRALWTQSPASFSGETVRFDGVHFNPKPVQHPHPPIFVGGHSRPALRRVARRGQGWYAYDLTPEELGSSLDRLDSFLADEGRSRADVKIYASPNRRRIDAETVRAYADLGVRQLIAPLFARTLDDLDRRIDRFVESARID